MGSGYAELPAHALLTLSKNKEAMMLRDARELHQARQSGESTSEHTIKFAHNMLVISMPTAADGSIRARIEKRNDLEERTLNFGLIA